MEKDNLSEEEYEKHIVAKDKATLEKHTDTQNAHIDKTICLINGHTSCNALFSKASALYLWCKLQVHNFTFSIMSAKKSTAFLMNCIENGEFCFNSYNHLKTV